MLPPKEKLPAFKTGEECVAYCIEQKDNFYLTAFMLEAWIGAIIAKTVEQYAENKSGQRHLQTGVGWETWQFFFGQATSKELAHILESLIRFANCDTGMGEMTMKMFNLIGTEDKHGEPTPMSAMMSKMRERKVSESEAIKNMRETFQRMSEWMEAIVHWQTHWMSATVPITFQATEEKRELANLGIMQAGYAALNEHGKDWWNSRHTELAEQHQNSADWRLVGKAQSFDKFRELRQPMIDELTIHWWPLLTHYRWTDRDMRLLLLRVAKHPEAYPLRDDKEFADYRKKALGLVKGKKERDKSAPDGKPTGWQVALAMVGKLSE